MTEYPELADTRRAQQAYFSGSHQRCDICTASRDRYVLAGQPHWDESRRLRWALTDLDRAITDQLADDAISDQIVELANEAVENLMLLIQVTTDCRMLDIAAEHLAVLDAHPDHNTGPATAEHAGTQVADHA